MIDLTNTYFEQYGFVVYTVGDTTDLTYGLAEEQLIETRYAVQRSSVLFSIIERDAARLRMSVTPALLDMPVEPPFLIGISAEEDVHKLFDAHRAQADAMDFAHGRIAQYLALRHMNRRAGNRVDNELLAYLTRRDDLAYAEKLAFLLPR